MSEGYVDAAALTAAVDRVSRGVVRVSGPDGAALSTGWLVTSELVVVPAYVLQETGGQHRCETATASGPATVVFGGPSDPEEGAPALLRLEHPLPGAEPLELAAGSAPGDSVFVVHYPDRAVRPQISFGRIQRADHPRVVHDAATSFGSSGAPVLALDGRVVSMSVLLLPDALSSGPSLGALVGALREAPEWAEITARHQLADVASVRNSLGSRRPVLSTVDDELLTAAVHWSIDPAAFAEPDRDRLAPLVLDTGAPRWTMRAKERRRLLSAAGSLAALRVARGKERVDDPRQRVIDRILDGPPYLLDAIREAALPYWLQAVRWFAGVAPGLPGAADVGRAIERRRLRSRLRTVAGADFHGRGEELQILHAWYDDPSAGPMTVTGIGGIGKSALVARFANGLSEQTLLCWLDFDRPDLAPDDAESIVAALAQQLSVQVEGLPATQTGFRELARSFAAAARARPRPLLVLDGFEVAQHVRRYGEIWPVLERLQRDVPGLRVVVCGRAPVPDARLGGRDPRRLDLAGLDAVEAAAWLHQRGVRDPVVLARVLDLANGIPLALHLAVRFLDTGGDVADLPEHLPRALVDGMLYNRILDRVIDPRLRTLARDALVLRRLTAGIVERVLGGSLPAGLDARAAFDRLARELALVAGPEIDPLEITLRGDVEELRVRPDVRSAALALLARDDAARVRDVDAHAADYYAGLGSTDPVVVAELVYHRLRLGDLTGAAAVWREECSPLLGEATGELPPPSAAWLSARLSGPSSVAAGAAAWEADALQRIRSALARGLRQAVGGILRERTRHAENGRLRFYDAWLMWSDGDPERALSVLDAGTDLDPAVARDRDVLGALIQARRDPAAADARLARIREPARWTGFAAADLLALAVWAARVRLTVDLGTERGLLALVRQRDDAVLPAPLDRYLRPDDVLLEPLARVAGRSVLTGPLPVPATEGELAAFRERLAARVTYPAGAEEELTRWAAAPGAWRSPPDAYLESSDLFRLPARITRMALDLAVLGRRRRTLLTGDLSPGLAFQEAVAGPDALRTAVVATLAAFRNAPIAAPGTLDTPDEAIAGYRSRLSIEADSVELFENGPEPLELLFRYVAGMPLSSEIA